MRKAKRNHLKVAQTMNKIFSKKTFSVLLAAAALLSISGIKIQAQQGQPRFLVTWKSSSYVPPIYSRKALPGPNSSVTASFELVQNGKLVSLTGKTIYWYLNDDLLPAGTGKQSVGFLAPANVPASINLRIQIADLSLTEAVTIPAVAPQVVIIAPFPNGQFSDASIKIKSELYFFNIKNPLQLNYAWTVNGKAPQGAENPAELSVNINPDAQSGSGLNIGLVVQNPQDTRETATSRNLNLTFVK